MLIVRSMWLKLFVIFGLTSLSAGDCPPHLMKNFGRCAYRIYCYGTVGNITLREDCREASNFPVTVDLSLIDPVETSEEQMDLEFLSYITTLNISGLISPENLISLTYTNRLQYLYLDNNNIEKIPGEPFMYLHSIRFINLSHNKLRDVDELFRFELQPNKLTTLSLAYNDIENIAGDAFSQLSSLKTLDLSNNIISDLTEEPFFNLTKLEILRLNNNRIKDLNGALNTLEVLKHLYLRGNVIQNIDEQSLNVIKHLETLDVSLNYIEKINPIMLSRHWQHIGNHSVCKIILSENQITVVPNATLKEISSRFIRDSHKHIVDIQTDLNLSGNSITSIEYNAFQSLIKLTSLDLSRNKLIDFVVNSYDLADVKCLNLSSNYISQLYYDSFASMTYLQNLDLSYNRLEFIPDMVFNNNNNLKLVNMTYNEIAKLDKIQINMFHPSGGVLDLSNNDLFKIRIPYGEGLRLITLKLHLNNITDANLIDLQYQRDLKDLDLSKNFIYSLDASSLHLPKCLEYLDLSYNRIQYMKPSAFHALTHLKTLRLNNNHLYNIEFGTFQGLPNLLNLDLGYNSIGNLDSQTLIELKKLLNLSVMSNGLNTLDLKSWYGHKYNLDITIDNNNLTCEWLGKALNDFNNGYTKVKPTALIHTKTEHSIEGISCISDNLAGYTDSRSNFVMADERLLAVSRQILEAVREQNYYIRKLIPLNDINEPKHIIESLINKF